MKEELAREKVENAAVKAELELTLKKMQFIAVDAILHAWVELMGEFKRGEHANWDLDQEIQTWKNREVGLAKGDEAFDEEEDESTPMAESPKQAELGDSSKQAEHEVGAEEIVVDAEPKELVEPVASQVDITKD